MEPGESTRKRSPADFRHFVLAVPRTYIYEQSDDSADEEMGKEVRYHLYAMGGFKDQTLGEAIGAEADALTRMGIIGDYDITFKKDAAWGRKTITLSPNFDCDFVVNEYKQDSGRCELMVKPQRQIWYKCYKLTDEEIAAAQNVIDRVVTVRQTKRAKLQ